MATKDNVTQMLQTFSEVISRKTLNDDIIDSYFRGLSHYSDDQIKIASFRCIDELKFFPKIPEIKERIVSEKYEDDDFVIKVNRKCYKCGAVAMCIREPVRDGSWECRQCYTGLTPDQFRFKMEAIYESMSEMREI